MKKELLKLCKKFYPPYWYCRICKYFKRCYNIPKKIPIVMDFQMWG